MHRVNTSRQTLSSKQCTARYRPNGQVAPHLFQETVEFESQEPVLDSNGSYWVQSKVAPGRFYRVVHHKGEWLTSSYSDERVARKLVAQVKVYIAKKAGAVC